MRWRNVVCGGLVHITEDVSSGVTTEGSLDVYAVHAVCGVLYIPFRENPQWTDDAATCIACLGED